MPQPADTADLRAPRGLILDFAGVLTADPRPTHRAWCAAQGLPPEAWRATLNDHPEGRRLYAAHPERTAKRPSPVQASRKSLRLSLVSAITLPPT